MHYKQHTRRTLIGLLLVCGVACKGELVPAMPAIEPAPHTPAPKALPSPTNGAPVAVEFLGFTDDDPRKIEARFLNLGDKTTAGFVVVARFFDESGSPVPLREGTASERMTGFMSFTGAPYRLAPQTDKTLEIEGVPVPSFAATAELIVTRVDSLEGKRNLAWFSQERWGEWPTE